VGDLGGSVTAVELAPTAPRAPLERSLYSSSACGACGKTSLSSLDIHVEPIASRAAIRRSVLGALPDRMRAAQAVFLETGGLHASGLFTPAGELVAVREDVGRHNALDKLIGWALGEGRVPLSDSILLVSGRVSYELMQKAIAAGIPIVAAVGAPSSLAVSLANRFGVTLAGFLRGDSSNVYAHGERIAD